MELGPDDRPGDRPDQDRDDDATERSPQDAFAAGDDAVARAEAHASSLRRQAEDDAARIREDATAHADALLRRTAEIADQMVDDAEARAAELMARTTDQQAARLRARTEELHAEAEALRSQAEALHAEAEQTRQEANRYAEEVLSSARIAASTQEDEAEPSGATPSRLPLRKIAGGLGAVLLVLLAAVGIRAYIATPFTVTQSSMGPGLEQGNRVLVNKLAYSFSDPGRSDVVVIAANAFVDRALVKRVVGLPGERIEASNGAVRVDGVVLEEDYLQPGVATPGFPAVLVDEDHVFVLGDNRASSLDSRAFGPVPVGDIVGRVEALIWPLGDVRII